MLVALLCWGVAGFGMMAPQQARLVSMAALQAPVLLSLNSSMMYFGMALGAALGGLAVSISGFDRLAWVGAPLALGALALLWAGAKAPATQHVAA